MGKFNKYRCHGAYHWEAYTKRRGYRKHVHFVRDWVKEKRVLDVGAGDGLITHILKAKGIDNDKDGVRLAQEKGADVILGDAYSLPFEDNSFEAVMMIDSLEHFDNPEKALQEARRVAPILYINTPPRQDPKYEGDTAISRYHVQEWSPDGLWKLVEKEGFELEDAMIVYPKDRRMYAKFKRT